MKTLYALLTVVLIVTVSACSDSSENKAGGDHVWKEQTDTIDRAKAVEGLMKKTAEDQAKSIEEQAQ